MQQYSLQPEKCWEVRHATQIDSSRSREYSASVTTCQDFFAAADAVWDALMFYEEIAEDRPFLLRRFLPTPIGSSRLQVRSWRRRKMSICGRTLAQTSDSHSSRVQNYAFEIVEQNLALRGIRLLGGDYTLRVTVDRIAPESRWQLTTRVRIILAGCSAVLKPPSATRFTVTFCPRCGATSDRAEIS